MTGTAHVVTGDPKHRASRGVAPKRLEGPAGPPWVRRPQAEA